MVLHIENEMYRNRIRQPSTGKACISGVSWKMYSINSKGKQLKEGLRFTLFFYAQMIEFPGVKRRRAKERTDPF